MTPAVDLINVACRLGLRQVFREASATLAAGRLAVILGQNGTGKSTLLRLIAGLLPAETGTIRVLGIEVAPHTLPHRKKLVSFLGQRSHQIFPFRVEDYVLTGRGGLARFTPSRVDSVAALAALEETGIAHLRDRAVTELSGGEMQLVRVARLLSQQTPLLLLDEPITHLDVAHQVQILTLLRDLVSAGRTVVTVLHDPTLALLFGDEFFFLREGRLAGPLGKAKISDTRLLESIYGVPLQAIQSAAGPVIIPQLSRSTPATE